MKLLATSLIGGLLATASLPCRAGAACSEATVRDRVEAVAGELRLADFLSPPMCPQLVKRAGGRKSCAEIAKSLANVAAIEEMEKAPGRWQEMNCAALPAIPEQTTLELVRTVWNAPARRWEFGMRCVRAEDCVPFMVSVEESKMWSARGGAAKSAAADPYVSSAEARSFARSRSGNALVKPGQTVTLNWDRGGIRVVLPVIALEGGRPGEFVRVRAKNATATIRAEVMGDGTLRANP
jgi:hypothetical protein